MQARYKDSQHYKHSLLNNLAILFSLSKEELFFSLGFAGRPLHFDLGNKYFNKQYPGLHQKKWGQQAEGGESLLCSGETSPGDLHPALEPSAQGRHGPVGVEPEKGHKNDQRDGTPLL